MTKAPQSGLLTESNMALFADYYELTMGKADFDSGNNAICTENYFVRSIPQGQYMIAAGLEQVIHYILNLRFTDADLKWLKESKPTPDMSDDFLDYLRHFKFDGDVYAVPEGTPVFANEPLINVTGQINRHPDLRDLPPQCNELSDTDCHENRADCSCRTRTHLF